MLRILRSDKELDYEDEISTALGKINEIISSEHKYPKFYATYGRLLSIVAYRGFFEQEIKDNEDLIKDVLNKFKEAKENIRKAIDMEKPEEIDYDLRIHKYYSYLMKIDYYKYMVLTTSKIAYIEKDIDSIKQERLRMIETLGVFSGFLGFILTALFSVSSGRIVLKNILSIDLMLLGSTISFFSFIHMLVLEKTRDKVLMALLILGLAIIIVSLIIL